MTLTMSSSAHAVAPGVKASFLANGGVSPFTYSVGADPLTSAGGTINPTTGVYTAPSIWNPDVKKRFDTIVATDDIGATVSLPILVGPPLFLFLEIIQRQMALQSSQVHLYQQKFQQPQDAGLQIAVSIIDSQIFGNTNKNPSEGSGMIEDQSVYAIDTLSVNIMSADLSAVYRRHDVLMALGSNYSQYQQVANSFKIGRIPRGGRMQNLSDLEPTRIPYRFHFPITLQYTASKVAPIEYYDQFSDSEIITN